MQPYKAWLFSDIIEKNKRVFKVPCGDPQKLDLKA